MTDEKKTEQSSSDERLYTHAPEDWGENGLPWAAACKCSNCGQIGRSTIIFDFYADKPGDPLVCETCTTGQPYTPAIEAIQSRDDSHD